MGEKKLNKEKPIERIEWNELENIPFQTGSATGKWVFIAKMKSMFTFLAWIDDGGPQYGAQIDLKYVTI